MRRWKSLGGVVVLIAAGCGVPQVDDERPVLPTASASAPAPSPSCNPEGDVCVDGSSDKRKVAPPSEKSTAMVADKQLTRDEYEGAFADFQSCVAKGGGELIDVNTGGDYIRYGSTTADGAVVDSCYWTHYHEADVFWQLYERPREDSGPAIEKLIACPEGTNVDPPKWKKPETLRERAFLYAEVGEFISDAWDEGLLTQQQGEACFAS